MTVSFSQLGNLGRMGNALFQCAATISLALKNNTNYLFPQWKYQNDFNLNNCFSNNINIKNIYNEPFFHYQTIPYLEDTDLVGYFRSYLYWQGYDDIIKSLLTPINTFPIKWGTTSIHIRHGDYKQFEDCHPILKMDYYQKAMDMIKSQRYLIVSDDIAWCKQNFIGEQFQFSEADEITDLSLQVACENNILSNSSFSWWGAYLNKNPSKIVVAPKTWFGPGLQHDTKDLCPPEWRRI